MQIDDAPPFGQCGQACTKGGEDCGAALFTKLDTGEKVLLFTQFTEMGELLKTYLQETFGREVLFLHGWAPHASQPKPLKPGSAALRLSEALGTAEYSAGEKVERS